MINIFNIEWEGDSVGHKLNIHDVVLLCYISTKGGATIQEIIDDLPLLRRKKNTHSKRLKLLILLGYLTVKKLSYIDVGSKMNFRNKGLRCCSCGFDRALHKHHYPIHKRLNGKDLVILCANCHHVFHEIAERRIYSIKEKFSESFKMTVLS